MESHLTTDISAKCGCNYTATKRISKTASISSNSKTQRATRFNVWSNSSFIAIVFIMAQILSINQVDAMAIGSGRLKKRHSSNTAADWVNPCAGTYEGEDYVKRSQKMASFDRLHRAIRGTYRTLLANNAQYIDISDFEEWRNHNRTYKFLPKLRLNSSVAYLRWHRSMQKYVGAFSYLRSKQRSFDEIKLNGRDSNVSKELNELLIAARSILCEIETTINQTTSYSGEKKLSSMSLEAMNKSLKFRTKKNNDAEVNWIDLKFVKFYFMDFLKKMPQIMRHSKSRNSSNTSNLLGNSSDTSNISSNSKSVTSNETNSSRSRLNGRKRLTAKKHNQSPKKPRQRLHKQKGLSIA